MYIFDYLIQEPDFPKSLIKTLLAVFTFCSHSSVIPTQAHLQTQKLPAYSARTSENTTDELRRLWNRVGPLIYKLSVIESSALSFIAFEEAEAIKLVKTSDIYQFSKISCFMPSIQYICTVMVG